MKDTSFIDLLKEENLNKIKIDKRLIPAFKKTIIYFQDYFNYMGWTKDRDYHSFFEKNLLDPINGISIICKKTNDYVGLYDINSKRLIINELYLKSLKIVIDIMTHEFIHFIVENHVVDNNLLNDSILFSIPCDEALTEMLKCQILPLTYQTYKPQIEIVKFWLIFNEQKDLFKNYLTKGKFNVNDDFKDILEKYQNKLPCVDEHMFDAINNPNYVKIQRYIINSYKINITNLEEYEKLVIKMSKRPVKDIYFMNKYYSLIEKQLIENLKINDNSIKNRFMLFIKKYRLIIEILNNYNINYICSFESNNYIYDIDYKRNLFIDGQFKDKIKYLKIGGVNFNLKDINLKELRRKKIKIQEELLNKKIKIEDILKYIIFINNNINVEDNRMIYKK